MAITTQGTGGTSYSTGLYDTLPLSDTAPTTRTGKNYRSKDPEGLDELPDEHPNELSNEPPEEASNELPTELSNEPPEEASNELPEELPLELPNELPEELGEESGLNDGSDSGNSRDDSDSAWDGNGDNVLNNLPLPAWARTYLKKWLGPEAGNALPSSADAFKTVRDFQKQNRTGLLSIDQMQQMAKTGYCTLSNGKIIRTPPEIRDAAQKFMENNGALFKRMEASIGGKLGGSPDRAACQEALKNGSIGKPATPAPPVYHGVCCNDFYKFVMNGALSTNRPAEYNAAKTINEFQKQYNIDSLSFKQLVLIAETGYCRPPENKVIQVPSEVREAARKFMENDGELLKKMEAAIGGKPDTPHPPTQRGVSYDDFYKCVMNGTLSANQPAEYAAAKTINEFLKKYQLGLLSFKQLVQIVETGSCTLSERKIQVPPEVQEAARKFIANDGALYKKLESAVVGNYEDSLKKGDDNESSGNGSPSNANDEDTQYDYGDGLPSPAAAAKAIYNFQQQYNLGLLGFKQMQQIAETGHCTLPNGQTVQVSSEVQYAARKFMANDGALFKKLEADVRDGRGGTLSQEDYEAAVNDEKTSGQPRRGLLSPADAAKAIYDFQKNNNIDALSFDQLKQIVITGRYTLFIHQSVAVQSEARDAARMLLERDAALWKRLESAESGECDGLLTPADYEAALKKGIIGQPASRTIYDFRNNIGLASFSQVKEIAETGQYMLPGGNVIQFLPEIQAVARKLLEKLA